MSFVSERLLFFSPKKTEKATETMEIKTAISTCISTAFLKVSTAHTTA
jgi:hypothetical protein